MQQLEAGFKKLGLSWLPSKGNFIAVEFQGDAAAINQALLEQGVIVRPVAGYGMANFLRVSIGTATENQRFLDVLTQVLQQD
jgi:histidinol-phosphate aminotransferase